MNTKLYTEANEMTDLESHDESTPARELTDEEYDKVVGGLLKGTGLLGHLVIGEA
jgi:hypothetical protein